MKIIGLSTILILFTFVVNAQSYVLSPYSRYGLGELQTNTEPISFSMGGLTSAFRNTYSVNSYNPASFTSFLHDKDSIPMVFNGGFKGNYSMQKNTNQSTKQFSGALNSMSFGFKAAKNWAMAFGLQPFSSVGYNIITSEKMDSINYKLKYEGSGGFNKFWLGNAFQFFNSLSVGFNASYIFGSLNTTRKVVFDTAGYYNSKAIASRYVGDFAFDVGLQYDLLLKKDTTLNRNHTRLIIGFNSGLPRKMDATQSLMAFRYYTVSGRDYIMDTTGVSDEVKGKVNLPLSISGGLMLAKDDRWSFGFDYKTQFWSEYESFGESDSLNNSTSINFGFSYKPKNKQGVNYKKQPVWYGGFHYDKTYLTLRNNNLVKFGITFGCTFSLRPMFNRLESTVLTTGIEFGKMGTTDQNLIKENYVRFVIGVALKERWFSKKMYY